MLRSIFSRLRSLRGPSLANTVRPTSGQLLLPGDHRELIVAALKRMDTPFLCGGGFYLTPEHIHAIAEAIVDGEYDIHHMPLPDHHNCNVGSYVSDTLCVASGHIADLSASHATVVIEPNSPITVLGKHHRIIGSINSPS